MEMPVRYVRSRDGTRIAYQAVGEGPAFAYLQIASLSHLQLFPRQPGVANFLANLGRGRKLIRIDLRGTGLSQRDYFDHSPEALTDDFEAVIDELGIGSLDIYAAGAQVSPTLRLALRRPGLVRRIVLESPFTARPVRHGEPGAPGFLPLMRTNWNLFIEMVAQRNAGGSMGDLSELIAFMRRCSDQKNRVAEVEASRYEEDWQLARRVNSPVLVTDRLSLSVAPSAQLEGFTRQFPNGRFIALPERSAPPPFGDPTLLLEAVEEFLRAANDETTANGHDGVPELTARERQVLALLANGRTDREIASALVVSESTASRHVANIYRKLGVHRRAEAAVWAIHRGVGAR